MNSQPIVLLVTGSRDWTDHDVIHDRLEEYRGAVTLSDDGLMIRHGACRGADLIADREAKRLGLMVDPWPADWKVVKGITEDSDIRWRNGRPYDAGAGRRRNIAMLDADPRPNAVLAFQKNGSSGTQHTIDEARKRGINVEVVSA